MTLTKNKRKQTMKTLLSTTAAAFTTSLMLGNLETAITAAAITAAGGICAMVFAPSIGVYA